MEVQKTKSLNAHLHLSELGKLPHVCGGRYSGCDEMDSVCVDNGKNDECYRYNPGSKGTVALQYLQYVEYSINNPQNLIHGQSQES